MANYILKSKNHNSQEKWIEVYKNIEQYITKEEIDKKINNTVSKIKKMIKNKNVAYAWSGGKDSLALQVVMEKAGINKGLIGICEELEYPSFLRYIKENIPAGIEIINIPIKYEYLQKNTELIFPKKSLYASKWFQMIQHKAQDRYFKENKLDMLILGRRKQDGNYVGQENIYTKKDGITRYSPLADWKHEDILATIHYYKMELPKIYFMHNGFNIGTHVVLARTGETEKCLEDIYQHEKEILLKLSKHIGIIEEYINEREK